MTEDYVNSIRILFSFILIILIITTVSKLFAMNKELTDKTTSRIQTATTEEHTGDEKITGESGVGSVSEIISNIFKAPVTKIIAIVFVLAMIGISFIPIIDDHKFEMQLKKEIELARKRHIEETSLEELIEKELKKIESETAKEKEPADKEFAKLCKKYEKMSGKKKGKGKA